MKSEWYYINDDFKVVGVLNLLVEFIFNKKNSKKEFM